MRFGLLPLRLRCLIAAKSVAAVAVMVWFWTRALPADLTMLALLTLFGAATGIWKVDAQVRAARITVTFTVSYFALLLLGPAGALLVALVGVLGGCLVHYDENGRVRLGRTPLYRLIYNLANVIVSIAATASVYQFLGGTYQRIDIYSDAVPIIASTRRRSCASWPR